MNFVADGLASKLRPMVLDVGCGWAELLLRVLEGVPSATGIGVDNDDDSIDHARRLAQQRGLSARVEFLCGDARTPRLQASADAVICVGASHIWGSVEGDSQPMDYTAALSALRALVPRGGRVLYGECVWSRPPTLEAIAPLGGRHDEYVPLAQLLEIAIGCGFAPILVQEASQDEWDEFESGYAARYARWLACHEPDHPYSAEVRERASRQRTNYFGGYRGVLGFVYLGLIAI